MKVSDILRVKGGTLYTITPEDSLADAAKMMSDNDLGSRVVMPHGLVVQCRETVQVESAAEDSPRQLTTVQRLLTAEAESPQLVVVQLKKTLWRQLHRCFVEPVERGSCRRQRDLLLENDQDQRRVAGLARPERRIAMLVNDGRQIGVDIGQAAHTRRQ